MYDLILVGKYEKYSLCILIPPPSPPPGVCISSDFVSWIWGSVNGSGGESLYRRLGSRLGWVPGGWAGLAGLSWAKLLKSGRGVQKAVIVGYSLGGGGKKLS